MAIPKIKLKEQIKTYQKVLDDITIEGLLKLFNKKIIKEMIFPVKEGKESVIFYGKGFEENEIAIKIYRIFYCDFKNMWKYLIADPRFFNIKKDRKSIVFAWCKREFKNLKIAYDKAKILAPKPIAFWRNILVMEFIGKNGNPAPRLCDIEIQNPEAIYSTILEQIKKLYHVGLVHGDLSAFNILLFDNKPFFIDFSQGVKKDHPLFKEFLLRDIKNINDFFKKFIQVIPEEEILKEWENV